MYKIPYVFYSFNVLIIKTFQIDCNIHIIPKALYHFKKCIPSITLLYKNKQYRREKRGWHEGRQGYVGVAIGIRGDRLSPGGLTKTIMYKSMRELSIDTAKQWLRLRRNK